MAANNQINQTVLSGVNVAASGSFVGSNSPTLVTPSLGVASATSLNFGASSTLGVIGTTTNNNADAGRVGEFVSSSVEVAGAVALTASGTVTNITSISLSAGDWDVSATILGVTSNPGTATSFIGGVSDTSATLDSPNYANYTYQVREDMTAAQTICQNVKGARYSLAGTTTIYMVAQGFYSNSMSAYGFLSARRVR